MTVTTNLQTDRFTSNMLDLEHLSALRFSGADARSFLHKQLTGSIEDLRDDQVGYSGYCNPKGRLLATGLVFQDSRQIDTWWWIVRADLAAFIVQRLKMFVLRDKVQISLMSQMRISGCFSSARLPTEVADPKNWTRVASENGYRLCLPCPATSLQSMLELPNATYRYLEIAESKGSSTALTNPASEATGSRSAVAEPSLPASNLDYAQAWKAHDLLCGIVWIGLANQERFIPQTVNLDLNSGVSFSKGCYPGQEIVARTHYLGKVKRRALLAQGWNLPNQELEGSEFFENTDIAAPVARVINSCRLPDCNLLLVETQENSWRSHEAIWTAALEPKGEPYQLKWLVDQPDPFEPTRSVPDKE